MLQLVLILSKRNNSNYIRSEHQIDNSKQTITLVIVLLDQGNTKKSAKEGILCKKIFNLAFKCRQMPMVILGKTSLNQRVLP